MVTMETGTALAIIGMLGALGRVLWKFSANVAGLGSAVESLNAEIKEERQDRKTEQSRTDGLFDKVFEAQEEQGKNILKIQTTCRYMHGKVVAE